MQTAISNLEFGIFEKLFIRFSEAWWLPIEQNKSSDRIDFYRFICPLSACEKAPKGAVQFYSLARIHNPQPVFGVITAVEIAKYLVSLPKDEPKSFLQTYYISRLPNYDANNPACQILEVDSTAWSNDPLSGFGSFTHIPVGSDTGVENMNILSEMIMPAGDGGVWFAGEHVSEAELIQGLRYTGMATVNGAYKSGERAANKILDHHSGK